MEKKIILATFKYRLKKKIILATFEYRLEKKIGRGGYGTVYSAYRYLRYLSSRVYSGISLLISLDIDFVLK